MSALARSVPIAVIGAGPMGAGITQMAAQARHAVRLFDTRPRAAATALKDIGTQLDRLSAIHSGIPLHDA